MTGANEAVTSAVLNMIDACEAYVNVLNSNAAQLRECVMRLENGEDIVAVVRSAPGAPGREAAKGASDLLDKARVRFRTQLVSACTAGGMTRKEIASNMGISRQLIERYLTFAVQSK